MSKVCIVFDRLRAEEKMLKKGLLTNNEEDLKLLHFVDDLAEIAELIEKK